MKTPQGHLAHYINDTIDTLDLSAFFKRYQGGGSRNQPFHPAMMVKVLVYGYATGVFSSRKIAKKLHEDGLPGAGGRQLPKPRTLSDFRALHLESWRRCSCKWSSSRESVVWSSWAPSRWTAPSCVPRPASTRR